MSLHKLLAHNTPNLLGVKVFHCQAQRWTNRYQQRMCEQAKSFGAERAKQYNWLRPRLGALVCAKVVDKWMLASVAPTPNNRRRESCFSLRGRSS